VVNAVAPGAVLMPWKDSVTSILFTFFPGQEYGAALVDVLFGQVNPSAKLPITIPNIENEMEMTEL
jgi:beta-glucosidase